MENNSSIGRLARSQCRKIQLLQKIEFYFSKMLQLFVNHLKNKLQNLLMHTYVTTDDCFQVNILCSEANL